MNRDGAGGTLVAAPHGMPESPAERVKERIDLVALIQESLPLKRAGSNFKARCPFHEEDTPSFIVSPSRQTFHCFGCSKHGDCFTWLMEREGMSFPEALRVLASRAGVTVAFDRPERREERERLRATLDLAATFYARLLSETRDGEAARAYLASRGLTPDTIAAWRLGYCPEASTGILQKAAERGVTEQDLLDTGVVHRGASRTFEFFHGRILFPLADAHGSVIGLAGRVFGEARPDAPKYINSPETTLYKKSGVLYGLDRAKAAIRKESLAVLVEGYTDVVLSHQAGVSNVVATSGTALTDDHLRLLRRFTERIAFAFDADAAGETATRRAIDLALGAGFLVSIVVLPAGDDPADLAVKDAAAWRAAIAGRRDVMAFLFERARTVFDLGTAEGKRDAAADLLPLIARVLDAVVRGNYVQQLASLVSIDPKFVYEELKREGSRQQAPGPRWVRGTAVGSRREVAPFSSLPTPHSTDADLRREERFLALLLAAPDVIPAAVAQLPVEALLAPATRALYTEISRWYADRRAAAVSPATPAADLRARLPEDLQSRLDGLLLVGESEADEEGWDPRAEAAELLRTLRLQHLRGRLQNEAAGLSVSPEPARQERLRTIAALTSEVAEIEHILLSPHAES